LHEALAPGRLGAVVLVLAPLAFVPTLVVGGLAWLAGPGFAVGEGTLFSPTEVVAAPLPAVPVLGVLPQPGAPGLGWVVLAPLVVGAGVGLWLHRRRFQQTWWEALLSGVVATGTVALTAAVLCVAASGGIGPGRLATVRAAAPAVAGALAWVVARPGGGVAAARVARTAAVHRVAAAGGGGPGRLATVGAAAPAVAGALAWRTGLGAGRGLLALHPQVHALVARGYRAVRARLQNADGDAGTSPTSPSAEPSEGSD